MAQQFSNDVEAADALAEAYKKLKNEIAKVVVGQDDVVRLMLTGIFCQGHSQLIGVPGLAKTLLVQTIATSLDTIEIRSAWATNIGVLGAPFRVYQRDSSGWERTVLATTAPSATAANALRESNTSATSCVAIMPSTAVGVRQPQLALLQQGCFEGDRHTERARHRAVGLCGGRKFRELLRADAGHLALHLEHNAHDGKALGQLLQRENRLRSQFRRYMARVRELK